MAASKAKAPWREVMERADELWEKFAADLKAESLGSYVETEAKAKAEFEAAEEEKDRD